MIGNTTNKDCKTIIYFDLNLAYINKNSEYHRIYGGQSIYKSDLNNEEITDYNILEYIFKNIDTYINVSKVLTRTDGKKFVFNYSSINELIFCPSITFSASINFDLFDCELTISNININ